jgi:hypothetical protein
MLHRTRNSNRALKITIKIPTMVIITQGTHVAFKNVQYESLYSETITLSLPMRAVGGSPSPKGQSKLSPAIATVACKPMESKNQIRGIPMMAAAP